MKITIFEVESWERPSFDGLQCSHEVTLTDNVLNPATVGEHRDTEIVSTFVYSRLDESVIENLPNLKLIATRSTGFDHIPIEACRARGITVCNVPKYGANTVAEHVFGLLLTISHRLEQAIDRTRKGDFSARGLQGFDLAGKTMGIVGTGDIGSHVIRIAKGFSMNVLAFDVQPDQASAIELGFQYVSLEQLFEQSDIVSLHVPNNPRTRHMIGRPQFERMKRGCVLINTARGEIIDTQELARALAEGTIAAAGLDVLPDEPVIREELEVLRSVYEKRHNLETLLANHVFVHMRNVVVTPHSAFNTKEAVQRILDTTIENIEAYLAGVPINRVA